MGVRGIPAGTEWWPARWGALLMCRPGRPGQLDTGLGLGCRGVHARGLGSPDPLVLGATSLPPKPWSPPTIFMASSHCGPKLGLRKGGRQRAATGAPPSPELATHSCPSLSPSEGPAETGPRSTASGWAPARAGRVLRRQCRGGGGHVPVALGWPLLSREVLPLGLWASPTATHVRWLWDLLAVPGRGRRARTPGLGSRLGACAAAVCHPAVLALPWLQSTSPV